MPPAQTIEWNDFYAWFARIWKQGDHVSIIGPTNRGKTTLAQALLPIRDWTVVFGTKKEDPSLEKFARKNSFKRQELFRPIRTHSKYIVWPKYGRLGGKSKAHQRDVFAEAFQDIYDQGSWCLYIDEIWYFSDALRMDTYLEEFWSQSRSNNITFVSATQRPRNIPLMMYDQATHIFFFRVTDGYARKRIGEIGSIDSKEVANEVANLSGHQFLYVNLGDDTIPRMISEVKL